VTQGIQLRIRLTKVKHLTPKNVLRKPLRFPAVLGDDFEISEDSGWTDYTTIGAGELSSPLLGKGARMLQSFGAETLSMTWDPSWMTYPGQSPGDVRDELTRILRSRAPVQLLAVIGPTGHRPEFSGLVTMRSLSRRLRHGEPDTRYFAMDFRRYREADVERRKHRGGGGGGDGGGSNDLPTKHRLHSFDTLEGLARDYYGKAKQWRDIGYANGIRNLGSEDEICGLGRFRPGDVITIPKPKTYDLDVSDAELID
jgi:hypothetical protein